MQAAHRVLVINAFLFVPGHTFLKTEPTESQLRMSMTDDDAMRRLLDEEPNPIAHADPDGRLVLCAPPAELRAFVCKYARDSRLFARDMTLRRIPASPSKAGQPGSSR